MPTIKSICKSNQKGTKKSPIEKATLITGFGIQGDAHAGRWHRQISILNSADIDIMREKGMPNLAPGDFAENLIISGLNINILGLGSQLKIGNNAEILITQIGKKCHNHCNIYHQTGDCIMPTHGLFARVVKDGTIQVGDSIEVLQKVPRSLFQVVILTISDRCSRGETSDTAGPAVAACISNHLPSHIYRHKILPDEQELIENALRHYSDGHSIDLILLVGGTGFAPRDVTPEAVIAVAERLTPGLDEAMRRASSEKTSYAILSRAASGIRDSTLIISLPGSEKAAVENLMAVIPALEHGLNKLRGDTGDCGRKEKNHPKKFYENKS